MYKKITYEELVELQRTKQNNLYVFTIFKTQLACNERGDLYRKMKSGYWKEIENKKNHIKGYNVILINKKQFSRSKVILYAQNKITLNENRNIYHINGNRLDCNMSNLKMIIK